LVAGDLAADVGSGTAADSVEGPARVVDLGEGPSTAEMVGLTGTSICMVRMMLLSLDEMLVRLDGEGFTGGGFPLQGGVRWLAREFEEAGISTTELGR